MDKNPSSGVCQFYLIVVTIVVGVLTLVAFRSEGFGVVVTVLASLCLLCLWGALFAPEGLRGFLTSIFTSGV